jgi:hypothetical protein
MNSGYIKIIISIILASIIIFIAAVYNIGGGLVDGLGNIFTPDKIKNKTDNRILYILIIPIILAFWGIYDLVKK